MFTTRRSTRPLALACATAALAIAPAAASARPAPLDPAPSTDSSSIEAAPVVRQSGTSDDSLAIILSGGALVLAAAGAGMAGRSQRRLGRTPGPQA